ncbi:leucine-rich repeat extensin-like protein 5 [Vicia villosa]|uniref:leucine-rich repeat extensin-like protein 5 n=1 Tax=Vicia villosa TaxID=3911 RepID=UPI00273B8C92|nr:leucine-rich repeat extensin-like protein 5 [Vicia villosa]
MAPPKPPNPPNKEIIDEAIATAVQTSRLHLDAAIQETQQQLDERFHMTHDELQQLRSRMDHESSLDTQRYDSLVALLQSLQIPREVLSVSAQSEVTPSGMTHHPSSPSPSFSQPVTLMTTPVHTPIHYSAPLSFAPTHTSIPHLPPHLTAAPPPPPFPPYSSFIPPPSPFLTTQPPQLPFTPQTPYPQLNQIPPLPNFRSPKLELAPFDGTNPLEWLFQADQYFGFYNLPPEHRLAMISFYLKGDALGWFK